LALNILVSGALTGAFRTLIPQFEQLTGINVAMSLGPSSGDTIDAIPVRLKQGESPDVLIMVAPSLDSVIAQGLFSPTTRVDIARSRIGVGVRSGMTLPDIASIDRLRRTLLAAASVGYSEGASGVYVATELLHKLGIAAEMAGKMRKITGELVGAALVRGDVALAIQQISELKAVQGVDCAGPLPAEVQKTSVIAAAI